MRHNSTRHWFFQRRPPRDGFSLMEVIAAAALVGLMAVAAARPLRLAALGSLEAKTCARRLSIDLMRARRLAIITATPHQLMFQSEGDVIVGYQIRKAGTDIQMEVSFPRHLQLQSAATVEFLSTGEAVHGVSMILKGKASTGTRWQVDVAQATGAVFVNPL